MSTSRSCAPAARSSLPMLHRRFLRPALVLLGAGAMFAADGSLSCQSALAFTLAAFAATALVQTVLVAVLARRAGPPLRASYQPRAWLRLSLPLLLVAGFQIVLSQTDVVLVGSVAGFRDAWVYADSGQECRSCRLPVDRAARGDGTDVRRTRGARRSSRTAAACLLLCAVCLLADGPDRARLGALRPARARAVRSGFPRGP